MTQEELDKRQNELTPISNWFQNRGLFSDQATKGKAYTKIKDNDYVQCIGIADAKYWERELDLAKSSERDTFTNLNPSFQIAGYLTGTKQRRAIFYELPPSGCSRKAASGSEGCHTSNGAPCLRCGAKDFARSQSTFKILCFSDKL